MLGFLAASTAAMVLAATIGNLAKTATPVGVSGVLGAFFGPFIGILRGKWLGPVKKKRRSAELSQGASH